MKKRIALMAGDGIGPEVMESALKVLNTIVEKYNHDFETVHLLVGGSAYDQFNSHLPVVTIESAKKCDAILFGSVGGPVEKSHEPKWKNCEKNSILSLRKEFNFGINLRPIEIFPEVSHLSPLNAKTTAKKINILFVRELLGDIYFGEHKTFTENGVRKAIDVAEYSEDQIAVVVKHAFECAKLRDNRVCMVHKANVLDTSKLWQTVSKEIAQNYKEVEYSEMLVDACAMQVIINPAQFDVIVTANLFGDILSDLGAALPGSLGFTPSASINKDGFGMFEPSGGSAPDIAGKNIANPTAQILSLAMLLKYSFHLEEESKDIVQAVRKTLKDGILTADLQKPSEDSSIATTIDFTDSVVKNIKACH